MKHILKKFLSKVTYSQEVAKVFNDALPLANLNKINLKDHIIFGTTDSNEMISMFTLYQGKEKYIVPEPDIVVCLFECGRQYAVRLPELRKTLLSELADTSKTMNNSYNFYAAACLAATSLVNALEAFMNRQIPNDFEYIYQEPQRKVIQNKEQIERNLSFEKKIKDIIPLATGESILIQNQKNTPYYIT